LPLSWSKLRRVHDLQRSASSIDCILIHRRHRLNHGIGRDRFCPFLSLTLSCRASTDEIPLILAGSASSNGGEIIIPVPDSGGVYSLLFLWRVGQDFSTINL
jgi:hypothetical protein